MCQGENVRGECAGEGLSMVRARTPMREYKSLRVVVMTSVVLVNTQRDRQFYISSAIGAKNKWLNDIQTVLCAGSITFANMGVAMLEPSLPLWMLDTMDAPKWQQGTSIVLSIFAQKSRYTYVHGSTIYGTEACPTNSAMRHSLDFAFNKVLF